MLQGSVWASKGTIKPKRVGTSFEKTCFFLAIFLESWTELLLVIILVSRSRHQCLLSIWIFHQGKVNLKTQLLLKTTQILRLPLVPHARLLPNHRIMKHPRRTRRKQKNRRATRRPPQKCCWKVYSTPRLLCTKWS